SAPLMQRHEQARVTTRTPAGDLQQGPKASAARQAALAPMLVAERGEVCPELTGARKICAGPRHKRSERKTKSQKPNENPRRFTGVRVQPRSLLLAGRSPSPASRITAHVPLGRLRKGGTPSPERGRDRLAGGSHRRSSAERWHWRGMPICSTVRR